MSSVLLLVACGEEEELDFTQSAMGSDALFMVLVTSAPAPPIAGDASL
ncbi:MAG: hypothetical protein ACI9MC_004156, partial [Kiritimatiellia bacterium]